jgi:PIN domain nuclease of toxin-antitoxin system
MKLLLDTHLLVRAAAGSFRLLAQVRALLDNGFEELSITSEHVLATAALPSIHKDPFDRLLVAQSIVEGITLLTADPLLGQYPAPVQTV